MNKQEQVKDLRAAAASFRESAAATEQAARHQPDTERYTRLLDLASEKRIEAARLEADANSLEMDAESAELRDDTREG